MRPVHFFRYPDLPPQTGFAQAAFRQHVKIPINKNLLNGASFDPQHGTIHGTIPPAIQHLTTEILAEEGQYQVLARWDTPRVVKGVSFSLRLNVAAEDGSDRLVSSAETPDTQYRFRG
ncbi:Phage tail fiber protein [Salmonella enterica subsp. arizonae]|uniref:Phage tail fiber protein n=1 Tax=Salmonella enterica subsp. arizonae TaxID=59203 RepID=A0A379SJE2_SALER|nr:Phage tail fiber protein [Salmonella enterica]SUG25355.1 Phage tail fiber protein [Salmonella enterica subsp. arizonae]SUF61973.1 Phage tail fiber protein [Salmonella enterica]SUG28350.1 Phage tail fiber protein [Salmonella enterica subsp. arizonae]SUG39273.1 Phage tail fiber protein [Salmonella enterica subsp. arizonae]